MGLDETRADWTHLAETDPLWAVLVQPGKRNGGWDLDEFLATGAREVEEAMSALARFGGPDGGEHALDFGCGVGRLSQALAQRYTAVTGVDIAPPMVAEARRIDRSGGRCTFVVNDAPDLRILGDASVDLVFSSLVLQHIPPAAAHGYLREMARVVRPGGAVVLLLPTGTRLTARGLMFRFLPNAVVRFGQRHVLRYPAPMRMHTFDTGKVTELFAERGLRLAGTTSEPEHGPHWHFTRFFWIRD
jgi:SAM-dependent methyltransferase